MSILPEYIIKLSIALAGQYLLYVLLLRKLTFFRVLRFFFIGSVIFSFLVPLVSIEWLYSSPGKPNNLLQTIPALNDISFIKAKTVPGFDWSWLITAIMIAGSVVMLCRIIIQFIALARIKRGATVVKRETGITFYEPGKDVPSFSFGRMVFLGKTLNRPGQADYIIAHEKVHVREMHTADILLMELVCVINWYNPFAWLMRKAVRENLEFIADDAVMNEGFNRKAYQYVMLQSASGFVLPLTSLFSMPNIKKRIAMMNSTKSSKMQLLKFTAVLPVLVFISVIFRQNEIMAQQAKAEVSLTSKTGVYIEGDFQDGKTLFIVDGIIQPQEFNKDYIKPNDITSINVWKGEAAVKKYGKKATNGVLEIFTTLPLCLINGKIQMKTSALEQLVRSEDIKSISVLKGSDAIAKYGENGKNGVMEIITKIN